MGLSRIMNKAKYFGIHLTWAALSLLIAYLSNVYDFGVLAPIRWLVLGSYLLYFIGDPFRRLLLNNEPSTLLHSIFFNAAIGLVLSYPAGILNIAVLEGRAPVYVYHLLGFVFFLFLFHLLGILLLWKKKTPLKFLTIEKFDAAFTVVILLFILGVILRFAFLGAHDVRDDEFYLTSTAYDLVNGIFVGREAYMISATDHSPLGYFISHSFLNILEPNGYLALKQWMLRSSFAVLGSLNLIGLYVLASTFVKKRAFAISAIGLAAVSAYLLIASKIGAVMDGSHLNFFLLLAAYFTFRFIKNPSHRNLLILGITSGLALLVKMTALPFVATIFLMVFIFSTNKRFRFSAAFLLLNLLVILPVIVFNAAAYLKTGYMDVPFASIFSTFGLDVKSISFDSDPDFFIKQKLSLSNSIEIIKRFIQYFGVLFWLTFAATAVHSLFSKKLPKKFTPFLSFLLLWIVVSLIFYSVTGFTMRYGINLSIPILLILSFFLFQVPKQWKVVYLTLLIIFSFFNSYDFFWNKTDYTPKQLLNPFNISHTHMNDLGSFIVNNADENQDAIVFSPSFQDMRAIHWYFQSGDPIRSYHDPNYKDKYILEPSGQEDQVFYVFSLDLDQEQIQDLKTQNYSTLYQNEKFIVLVSILGAQIPAPNHKAPQ